MNFDIKYLGSREKSNIPFTVDVMKSLVEAAKSHQLCNKISPDDIAEPIRITVREDGTGLFMSCPFAFLDIRHVMQGLRRKVEFTISLYIGAYDFHVRCFADQFDPVKILDQMADAIAQVEPVANDFVARFNRICEEDPNKRHNACDFRIEFTITNLDDIECRVENDSAACGYEFYCTLNELRNKNVQEVIDRIVYLE
jgi:hypothetical protein